MPITSRKVNLYNVNEQKESEKVFENMVDSAIKGSNDLVADLLKAKRQSELLDYFISIKHLYPIEQYKNIGRKIGYTDEITDKSQIPQPHPSIKPSKKVKSKKQEDSDSEYEPNEVKKITDSVLKDKLLKIKNETKEIKDFLKK